MNSHPDAELMTLVQQRITPLQAGYLRTPRSPTAVAQLAHLRRGLGKPPGDIPAIWDLTLADLPQPGHGDKPSRQENAVHAALTLYALHQQSRAEPMHVSRRSLGHAVRQLASGRPAQQPTTDPGHRGAGSFSNDDGHSTGTGDIGGPDLAGREKAVRRRFDAVTTATSFEETVHHLRGLISQLRAAGIGVDYARLTVDLTKIQTTTGRSQVRRRWGRDFNAVNVPAAPPDHTDTSTAETPPSDDHPEE